MTMTRTQALERITAACARVGRDPATARLLAVSKKQPVEKIRELATEGQVDFGENYPQEYSAKVAELADLKLRWHLIGHLQTNKVKMIVGSCALIHSVDSLHLAETISKRAQTAGVVQPVLLQVNVAGEESKEGLSAEELRRILPELAGLPGLRLDGLMTMPPLQNTAEDNRPHFRGLSALLRELRPALEARHSWSELSMGTSHDFEVAIEEGATIVRIGTALFGERSRSS